MIYFEQIIKKKKEIIIKKAALRFWLAWLAI